MSEHKKFIDQKYIEESMQDALDKQQVKLYITFPLQTKIQGNYKEVSAKLIEYILIYGNIESRMEII